MLLVLFTPSMVSCSSDYEIVLYVSIVFQFQAETASCRAWSWVMISCSLPDASKYVTSSIYCGEKLLGTPSLEGVEFHIDVRARSPSEVSSDASSNTTMPAQRTAAMGTLAVTVQ